MTRTEPGALAAFLARATPIIAAMAMLGLNAFGWEAAAQDSAHVRQQGTARPAFMLQPLTAEQMRARAGSEIIAAHVAAVGYAKAHGGSAAQYAEYLADRFAPTWGAPNSYRALRFFRAMTSAWMIWPTTVVEPLQVTDTLVIARVHRGYLDRSGPAAQANAATDAEFDDVLRLFTRRLATYVGVRYDDRVEGDWMVVTIAGAGSAAPPAEFPTGSYTATITQLPQRPDLVGQWTFTFEPEGTFTVRHQGEQVVRGTYTTGFDQLEFGDDEGPLACHVRGGNYRWVRGQQGALTFVRLSDPCKGRELVTARTLSPMP